ncbi:inovirus Gp2 family protein [Aeromonas encheleia]|nr:inovirus-type Gp2 protein [Aeromonas encheleia]UNP87526.1 inovirus Gp2 family protein [Aeromonas encheleia]
MLINKNSAYEMNAVEVEKLLQQVQSMYGEINQAYLMRSLEVIYAALNEWPRVFALRVDLRFAHAYAGGDVDSPTCFQRVDPQAMTRFIESLKNRLWEETPAQGASLRSFRAKVHLGERAGYRDISPLSSGLAVQ